MANILVVEGYPPSLSALTAALALGNHRVVEAKDGVEALAKARAEHFDLVISDILLPRMDGFEFVRQMRNIPASALTPVIFTMATYDQAEARSLAGACGVKYFLPRPSTSKETLEAVAAALSEPPPAATEAGPESERIHTRLLTEKLDKRVEELDGLRAGPFARSIMVVEDNPMDLDFMLQTLEENTLVNPVRVCRDGEEALEFIEAHSMPDDPDLPLLVLLDLRLPKVDGIEVLRRARQHPIWSQVPFIVVTTSRENSDISCAYELGVNSYIVKPVDFAAFAAVVKQIKIFWLLINEPPFPETGGH